MSPRSSVVATERTRVKADVLGGVAGLEMVVAGVVCCVAVEAGGVVGSELVLVGDVELMRNVEHAFR